VALLVVNTALWKADTTLATLKSPRRYWEDVCAAVQSYVAYAFPAPPSGESAEPRPDIDASFKLCQGMVRRGSERAGLRSWQFWRTIPSQYFAAVREDLAPGRPFEDPGRAMALSAGFRIFGGVAPYLLLWLGVLAAVPVLLWISAEFNRAGHPVAGVAFPAVLASSPFVSDCLTLTHSGIGFYLIAVVAGLCVAVWGVGGEPPATGAFLVRAGVVGVVFAACVLCRSGTLAVLPGLVLALVLAWFRRVPAPSRAWALAAGLALLVGPYLGVRPREHHAVWITLWEGLGDFDRAKGHYWRDSEARKVLEGAGLDAGPKLGDWVTPEAEAYFRRSVLDDVLGDPGWYVGILARRAVATVTQEKLRAWGSRDWRWIDQQVLPNEGDIEKYYVRTTTADWFGWGPWRVELPVPLLVAPTLAVLVASLVPPRSWRPAALLGCAAAATLPAPLLVTSAAMTETQAFVLVYMLGFALGIDALWAAARERFRTRAALTGGELSPGRPPSTR
jgi:hypothetical protein